MAELIEESKKLILEQESRKKILDEGYEAIKFYLSGKQYEKCKTILEYLVKDIRDYEYLFGGPSRKLEYIAEIATVNTIIYFNPEISYYGCRDTLDFVEKLKKYNNTECLPHILKHTLSQLNINCTYYEPQMYNLYVLYMKWLDFILNNKNTYENTENLSEILKLLRTNGIKMVCNIRVLYRWCEHDKSRQFHIFTLEESTRFIEKTNNVLRLFDESPIY